jgi:hypothetical protein
MGGGGGVADGGSATAAAGARSNANRIASPASAVMEKCDLQSSLPFCYLEEQKIVQSSRFTKFTAWLIVGDTPGMREVRELKKILRRRAAEKERLQRLASVLDATTSSGTLLMLEHINLNIGCPQQARTFYFDGLGAAADPRADKIMQNSGMGLACSHLLWANIGLNQLHLPREDPVQVMRGSIYVSYDPAAFVLVKSQLQGIQAKLEDTKFDLQENEHGLHVTCPFGNTFIISRAQYAPHNFIGHPGEKSLVGGIDSIVFTVAMGAAHGIARFYHAVFGTQARLEACSTGLQCVVPVGASQHLVFQEHAPGGSVAEYDGHHICVYTSDLPQVYSRLQGLGIIYNNPRFAALGLRYDTLEMSLAVHEVRFLDIIDPLTGEELFRLEHEVRTKQHPNFPCHAR